MNFNSLRNKDRRHKLRILSEAAGVFSSSYSDDLTGEEAENLLAELSKKFNVDSIQDLEGARRTAAQAAVRKEINSLIIESSDIKETRARLGNKGLLAASTYEIGFAPSYKGTVSRHIKERVVIDGLQHADYVDHVTSDRPGSNISLFSKNGSCGVGTSMLIVAIRAGARLNVFFCFCLIKRFFPEHIWNSPTAMAFAFADRYGVEFTLNGKTEPSKIVLDKIVGLLPEDLDIQTTSVRNPEDEIMGAYAGSRQRPFVGFAMVLDRRKYFEDLQAISMYKSMSFNEFWKVGRVLDYQNQ